MTQDELRAEFEALITDDILGVPIRINGSLYDAAWKSYQVCNAKRQEENKRWHARCIAAQNGHPYVKDMQAEMARNKALLRECVEALQCPIKSQQMLEKLKKEGCGNE